MTNKEWASLKHSIAQSIVHLERADKVQMHGETDDAKSYRMCATKASLAAYRHVEIEIDRLTARRADRIARLRELRDKRRAERRAAQERL